MSGLVLVTGATGFLGGRLARSLAADGCPVRGLGRDAERGARLEGDGISFSSVDLADQPPLDVVCRNVTTVVHCAALCTAWASQRSYYAANVVGTANLVAAARRNRVRRFIHVSTPAVLSRFEDQLSLTEDEPLPRVYTSDYGASKAHAERLVADVDDMESVVIRPKAIYGPGDTALLPRIIEAAARGRLRIIGDGETLTHLTHVDDVVTALRLAIDHDSPSSLYHIAGPAPVNLWDTIADLLRRLGHEPPVRRLSTRTAMRAAYAMEVAWRLLGRGEPPLTRYKVALVAYSQTLDTTRARRELGFRPRVSITAGLDTVVRAHLDVPRSVGLL